MTGVDNPSNSERQSKRHSSRCKTLSTRCPIIVSALKGVALGVICSVFLLAPHHLEQLYEVSVAAATVIACSVHRWPHPSVDIRFQCICESAGWNSVDTAFQLTNSLVNQPVAHVNSRIGPQEAR